MHIPDGFIDVPVAAAAGVIAVVGIGVCLRRASRELDDRTAPMAGLVAVYIFAVQMLNFPVAAGTSACARSSTAGRFSSTPRTAPVSS